MPRRKVGIVLFDDVEVLDFCGPFEVFSVTRLSETRSREEPSPFEVLLVAQELRPVAASGGLRVLPSHSFADCPALNILLVPGGYGTRREIDNKTLLDFVAAKAPEAELVTSVCTGSFILAKLGFLDGLKATTHWESLGRMRESFPQVEVDVASHVVEQGRYFTSAGISAGIDMALLIVARLHGEAVARLAAKHMEYPFPSSNERRVKL